MGTHPIFESDFDCLTDKSIPHYTITMTEFKDVGKASKDLFKKPFNVNKFDVDVKLDSYVIKNSIKGDAVATSFEMKRADVLCGLIPDLQQPYKTTLAGGNMKCEMNRAFASGANNLSCDFNTDTAVETGATSYLLKAKLNSDCGLITGFEATPAGAASIKYHATYPFKNMTFGVAGNLANPTALNYAVQSEGVSLETDLSAFNLNIYNKVDGATAVACQAGWKMGAADASFGFAAKRTLASGADAHFKTTGGGACELAHVSTISAGVKLTMSTGFNALKLDSEVPKFGMGLEFSL